MRRSYQQQRNERTDGAGCQAEAGQQGVDLRRAEVDESGRRCPDWLNGQSHVKVRDDLEGSSSSSATPI